MTGTQQPGAASGSGRAFVRHRKSPSDTLAWAASAALDQLPPDLGQLAAGLTAVERPDSSPFQPFPGFKALYTGRDPLLARGLAEDEPAIDPFDDTDDDPGLVASPHQLTAQDLEGIPLIANNTSWAFPALSSGSGSAKFTDFPPNPFVAAGLAQTSPKRSGPDGRRRISPASPPKRRPSPSDPMDALPEDLPHHNQPQQHRQGECSFAAAIDAAAAAGARRGATTGGSSAKRSITTCSAAAGAASGADSDGAAPRTGDAAAAGAGDGPSAGGGGGGAPAKFTRHVRNRSDSLLSVPPSSLAVAVAADKPLSDFVGQTRANALDPSLLDPKRAKRIIANRQSAHRSRMKKLQLIHELEAQVQTATAATEAIRQQVASAGAKRRLRLAAAVAAHGELARVQRAVEEEGRRQAALLEELRKLGVQPRAEAAEAGPVAVSLQGAATGAAPARQPHGLPPRPEVATPAAAPDDASSRLLLPRHGRSASMSVSGTAPPAAASRSAASFSGGPPPSLPASRLGPSAASPLAGGVVGGTASPKPAAPAPPQAPPPSPRTARASGPGEALSAVPPASQGPAAAAAPAGPSGGEEGGEGDGQDNAMADAVPQEPAKPDQGQGQALASSGGGGGRGGTSDPGPPPQASPPQQSQQQHQHQQQAAASAGPSSLSPFTSLHSWLPAEAPQPLQPLQQQPLLAQHLQPLPHQLGVEPGVAAAGAGLLPPGITGLGGLVPLHPGLLAAPHHVIESPFLVTTTTNMSAAATSAAATGTAAAGMAGAGAVAPVGLAGVGCFLSAGSSVGGGGGGGVGGGGGPLLPGVVVPSGYSAAAVVSSLPFLPHPSSSSSSSLAGPHSTVAAAAPSGLYLAPQASGVPGAAGAAAGGNTSMPVPGMYAPTTIPASVIMTSTFPTGTVPATGAGTGTSGFNPFDARTSMRLGPGGVVAPLGPGAYGMVAATAAAVGRGGGVNGVIGGACGTVVGHDSPMPMLVDGGEDGADGGGGVASPRGGTGGEELPLPASPLLLPPLEDVELGELAAMFE